MDVIPVANHLLWLGFKEKVDDLNSIKLQKMLYFIHGWYMAITNEVLIDQPFYKGQYGPIIPEVIECLKNYNGQPIDEYISQWDEKSLSVCPLFVNLQALPQFENIANQVWKQYFHLSTVQLSSLANAENTPWAKTENGAVISNTLIKEHFVGKAYENHCQKTKAKM